jgi:hypothetical protein
LRGLAGLAVAASTLLLGPAASWAQAPAANGNVNLLQPWLEGNPNNPPRFHRPGEVTANAADQPPPTGAFTATSRIGATPVYGSPTGFGAGNTGFDSSNARKKKRPLPTPAIASSIAPQPDTTFAPLPILTPPPPSKPPTAKKPPAPEIHPAKAAARPGAALATPPEEAPVSNPPPELHPAAAATRHGGALPLPPPEADVSGNTPAAPAPAPAVPPVTPPPTAPPPNTLPLGMQPVRPLPIAEGDPYAALGIRAGSFVLLPSLDLAGVYSTNPERVSGSPGAGYFVGGPELQVASDWSRNSLTADISGTYTQYADGNLVPSLNVPYFNSRIDGRVDVSRDTQIIVESRYLLTTDNPGSPNLQTQLAQLPIDTDLGGTLGVVQQFNRLSVAALGTFDRAVYDPSLLTDGQQASNADRNFDQTAGILRLSYDLDPGLQPFVQVQEDECIHDLAYDRSGLQRNSTGTTGLAGADVNLFGSLTGEMAGGWVVRSYKDPTLPDISGTIASGALIWQATPLTTAKLGASSEVYETIVDGASGQFTHDVTLEVDHALLRWLTATGTVGYGTDNYVGSTLRDDRYFVAAGLIYKLSREVQLRAQVREDWQIATQSTFSYTATSFLLGMHLQR